MRSEASSVVRAVNGPLGRRPLQRVINEHHGFFTELRTQGASWEQIAEFMASLGLRSRRGTVVTAGVLRVLYARAALQLDQVTGKSRVDTFGSEQSKSECRLGQAVSARDAVKPFGSVAEAIERAARMRMLE